MPIRGNIFVAGQYYHIYNRGAGRAKIFFKGDNYEYLLRLVRRYYQQYGAAIIAYCLMPNHYHFLLRQETDEPLSKFVNVLFNAYVQALNVQQGRTGTLFEGRFHHSCVEDWRYLSQLCKYIHRNPVKARLVSDPEDWHYSNYREWIGLRDNGLIDKLFLQDHFPNPEQYRSFVNDVDDENRNLRNIKPYLWD